MRRIACFFILLLAMVAFAALVPPSNVNAITYGFVDSDNAFSNVGAFIVQRPSDGHIFPICSGTLISPTVFLTAAHCTAFYTDSLAPRGFIPFVSFDNPIGFGNLTNLKKTNLIPITELFTNPNFSQSQSDSGDIGVLILPVRSTKGITPAVLPTLGLLDELAANNGLHDAVFIPVGYGLQNRVVGGGPPFFEDSNPIPRMFAFSSFDALNNGYIRLSQNPSTGDGGTCFGDSGGPNFLDLNGKRILAASTVTGDAVCRSTNVDYRLDTASAREFLGQFVTLP
ncbi:MAG TPA: trypsin-like serine protease [Acidobacteriota bacterium]|jgi:hypothetical protein